MPKMGDAMEAGTLSSWLKHEGDQVEVGDALAEIETDKTTMELEAEDAGVLTRLIAGEGDEVAVGEPIAVISPDGEAPDAAPDEARQVAEETADSVGGRETAETETGETEAAETEAAESGEQGARPREAEERRAATSGPERSADGRVRASPVVRRLAREHGIELAGISGSGPDGRIVERDVRAVLERAETGAPERSAQAPADAAPAGDGSTSAPVTAPAPSGAAGTELSRCRTQRVVGGGCSRPGRRRTTTRPWKSTWTSCWRCVGGSTRRWRTGRQTAREMAQGRTVPAARSGCRSTTS